MAEVLWKTRTFVAWGRLVIGYVSIQLRLGDHQMTKEKYAYSTGKAPNQSTTNKHGPNCTNCTIQNCQVAASGAVGALDSTGRLPANRGPNPLCSYTPVTNTHQTHPGASKIRQKSKQFIGRLTQEGTTSGNSNNTRTSNGPKYPPSPVVNKGPRSLPQARSLFQASLTLLFSARAVLIYKQTKVRDLGDKVLEPIVDTLGIGVNLRTRIRRATVRSCYPRYGIDKFLPKDELSKLLTRQSVEKALTKCQKYRKYPSTTRLRNLELEIETICKSPTGSEGEHSNTKSYRKIFVILVLLNKASFVSCFIDGGICDDDLPFCFDCVSDTSKWKCLRRDGHELPTQGFQDLSKNFFKKFMGKQWIVLVPYFGPYDETKDKPQTLMKEQIPPFTFWKGLPEERQGASGEISKTPKTVFAVKCVTKPQGKHEYSILKKFKNNKHNHLISILGAFVQNDVFHIIFPCAQDDLYGYWKKIHSHPSSDELKENLAWLAAQCQGITEGLAFIHRYQTASFKSLLHIDSYPPPSKCFVTVEGGQAKLRLFGRHGDIKPENILYFPRHEGDLRGVLVITDFGCTEFSTKEELNHNRRIDLPNSPTYRAPETDLSPDDSSVTSSYDIWTLGCVFLEFLTWWLGGWAYVQQFAAQRAERDPSWYGGVPGLFRTDFFYAIVEDERGNKIAHVRKGVRKFMDALASNATVKSNAFADKFLYMIRTRMLIIESLKDDGTKNGRASAAGNDTLHNSTVRPQA
ncbi:unnamed protein product [Fusarium graminearum]|uniref:Chromosome 1, complete genome n=1 Tax=Gibberella zeae (strain ATCC MYA-4620 / CBS 123657 / FGSC 9075 / NRRL 31084 / PH-1) TaxID=229533 RepID=A0A098D624_GIBZE|nr:unnamed protein product [Fusarium graminearum]